MANETILIVDDNIINLELATVTLKIEGYDVRTAIDAQEALLVLEHSQPRLILMDIQLPGMDGLEFTRQLRHDPRYSNIVILALTAFAMKGDEEKALAAGCDGYVAKPIDIHELPKIVRAHLV
jgi:CheY-like chemotaxis protein